MLHGDLFEILRLGLRDTREYRAQRFLFRLTLVFKSLVSQFLNDQPSMSKVTLGTRLPCSYYVDTPF